MEKRKKTINFDIDQLTNKLNSLELKVLSIEQ